MRRFAVVFLLVACMVAMSAATASAGYYGKIWLNWVYTNGKSLQSTGYTHLKQSEVQARSYPWGCTNMWLGTKYVGPWYCTAPPNAIYTPVYADAGVWAEPVAWNESGSGQQLWDWEYYYA